ncbi:MAG: tyrosine-type recombinase/integrase [Nitrospinae bacterium]|nr:tyrosine-type recombinase/integrase [Nitrospinota bacterium]
MKFTDSSIRAIKPKKERFEVWETNGKGFGLRVSPAGKKSWIYIYRFNGKARRMTLGAYPKMSLADAHEEHAKAKKDLSKGTDPGEKEQTKKRADRNAVTVQDLVDEFVEHHSKREKRSWAEDKRCLYLDVVPYIGTMAAKDVRRRDLIKIIDRIINRGSPGQAIRTKKVIAKMFAVGMERDVIQASPAIGLPKMDKQKPKPRKRYLTDPEIKEFWTKLPDSGISPAFQLVLKLLITTGQRRGEVAGAPWSEFNLGEKIWVIPGERTKNSFSHRVPLSELTIRLLGEVKTLNPDSKYLFPSDRTDTHIDPRAVTRAVRLAQGHWEIEDDFRPHDLRRTVVSGMAALGIPQLTISKVLNHREGGITKDYNQYQYDAEKKHALQTWERKLESILSGKKAKVVSIRGKHGW